MPMTSAGLSAAIKTNLTARGWIRAGSTELQQFCDDLAGAIVGYIQTNATVLPTSLVVGVNPVTGTGTIS